MTIVHKVVTDHTLHESIVIDENDRILTDASHGGAVHGPWLLCPDLTVARRIAEEEWICRHQVTTVDLARYGSKSSPLGAPAPHDERTYDDLKPQTRIAEILAQQACALIFGNSDVDENVKTTMATDVQNDMRLSVALYRDAAPRLRQLDITSPSQGDIAADLMPTAARIAAIVMPEPNSPLSISEWNNAESLWLQFLGRLAADNLAIAFGRDGDMPTGVYAIDLEHIPTGNLYQELGAWIYRAPQEAEL